MQVIGKGSIAWWIKWVLNALWYLLVIILALWGLGVVAGGLKNQSDLKITLPVRFIPDPAAYKISSDRLGIPSATLGKAEAELTFQNPGGIYPFALLGWNYFMLAVLAYCLHQMRRIFQSIAEQTPFRPETATRFRRMGWAILVSQVLGLGMTLAVSIHLKRIFMAEGLTLEPKWTFNLPLVFFGCMILVIAEVFRIGAELKQEQDLTV